MAGQPVIWKKRILIPFWVIRIILMVFIIFAYAVALRVLTEADDKNVPVIGVTVVFMLLVVAVLLMDVLSIILFARDALNPKTFLIMNVLQTTFWAAVLAIDLVAIARGADSYGIWFQVIVFVSFLLLLIYASINCHKSRKAAKRGVYAPAHNPLNPGSAPLYPGAAPYHSNIPAPAYGAPPHGDASPQLHQQHHGEAADYYAQPAKPAQMV
ncbi:hypothetical protein BCR34DRAFT_536107 [Clohesyomyces aquaticus]|uniref:MARVEL domain-containing protein n=1 Tax=Clohesyomyces aquaticus TaxID=1231657 RepID=A0A1Y1ZS71_9PLEO|nr:hypothetical protein BCR34DRAFT_536107 [Clohesyomyces aquaticus]